LTANTDQNTDTKLSLVLNPKAHANNMQSNLKNIKTSTKADSIQQVF